MGGGEFWGRTTGAKALFCLTAADTMLAGEKEKMPEELLQLEGRLVDEAMVGLDGTTGRRGKGWKMVLEGWGGVTGSVREKRQGGMMETERGELGLERGPRAEYRQTGRAERDWSMDDGRRDNILDSDQLAQTFFVK